MKKQFAVLVVALTLCVPTTINANGYYSSGTTTTFGIFGGVWYDSSPSYTSYTSFPSFGGGATTTFPSFGGSTTPTPAPTTPAPTPTATTFPSFNGGTPAPTTTGTSFPTFGGTAPTTGTTFPTFGTAPATTPPTPTGSGPVVIVPKAGEVQITPNVTRTWVTLTFLGTAGKAYRIISTSNPGASLRSWETVTRVTSTGNGLVAVALPVETGIPKFFAYRED